MGLFALKETEIRHLEYALLDDWLWHHYTKVKMSKAKMDILFCLLLGGGVFFWLYAFWRGKLVFP